MSDTEVGSGGIGGVAGVEPEHVDGIVVPDGENEDTTAGSGTHGSTESLQATEGSEGVSVVVSGLLGGAELIGD